MNVQTTSAVGVFQSDIIIHSALVEAIADMRRNPWLLDYVFASLAQDDLTRQLYGEKQIAMAKDWFLKTDIPVVMNTNADGASYPCLSIALLTSEEVENTLADVHYDPQEEDDSSWPALFGPFTPISYTPSTGVMKLPQDVQGRLVVVPGMYVVTSTGASYPILDVIDSTTITLAANITTSFNAATIKGAPPSGVMTLESCNFKEVYSIGAHVVSDGKSTTLSWLYAILKFIMLRYRQGLMEARGYERTIISFTPPKMEIEGEDGEQRFVSRYVNVTGYARDVWPKLRSPKVTSVTVITPVDDTTKLPATISEVDLDLIDSFGNRIG